MQLQQNVSLKPYNTFGIDVPAEYFIEIDDISQLAGLGTLPYRRYILGGGSNVLLTQPVKGLVIRNLLKGITTEREDDEYVWLRVQSGEVWHELVLYAIECGLGGIENLALIPGTVGASPMQNIGAYGMEARETIESVTCWHWDNKALIELSNTECHFGYRDSIFKHDLKDKVMITSVLYKLKKRPVYNTSYGAIEHELQQMGVEQPDVKTIAQAVMNIRTAKLPDPKRIGNAGSFFKNPTIPRTRFDELHQEHPQIPSYPAGDMVKLPAAWLIEHCGWKGYRESRYGVHDKQALVLVNYGGAMGKEVWDLSGKIVDSVKEKFGIELEREVQVW